MPPCACAPPAVTTGLAVLDAGGDSADGIRAREGAAHGWKRFVSFDKKAVAVLWQHGIASRHLV